LNQRPPLPLEYGTPPRKRPPLWREPLLLRLTGLSILACGTVYVIFDISWPGMGLLLILAGMGILTATLFM
jgi:hypothetical protein